MQYNVKIYDENQPFQENGMTIPAETEKNQLLLIEELATSDGITQKKTVKFRNSTSNFAIKKEGFIEKILRKLALKAPENHNEISSFLKEKFLDFKDSNFAIWLHYYFLYVDKDEAILQEIAEAYKEEKKDLMLRKTTHEIQLFLEFPKEKSEEIVKILDFFLENESFHNIFFARTMRKLLIKIQEIPLDFIKKIINLERLDFLNEILKFKEKIDKSCGIKRHFLRNKFYKWIHELISHEILKENNTNKHEILNKLISNCIQSKYNHLLKFLMDFSKKTIKNPNFTIEALENDCFAYIFKCLKVSRKYPSIFLKDQVFLALIQSLEHLNTFENAIITLFSTRKYLKDFNNLHLKVLLDKFQHLVDSDSSIRKLSYCENPTGIAILIVELLRLFSTKKLQFQMKLLTLASKMLELTLLFLKEINEISMLTEIICKPIAANLNMKIIDIITQNPVFYKEILSADFMVTLLHNNLSQGYQFDHNFFIGSTAFNYVSANFCLRHKPTNKIQSAQTPISPNNIDNAKDDNSRRGSFSGYVTKVFDRNIFNYVRTTQEADISITNHIYSYLIFTRNVNIRLFIAFVFFVSFLGLIYEQIYQASQLSGELSSLNDDISQYVTSLTLPSNYADLILKNLENLSPSEQSQNILYLKYIAKIPSLANYVNEFSASGFNPEEGCYEILVTMTNTPEMAAYMPECITSGSAMIAFFNDLTLFIIMVFLVLMTSSEVFVNKIYLKLRGHNPNYQKMRIMVMKSSFIVSLVLFIMLIKEKTNSNSFTVDSLMTEMKILNYLFNLQLLLLMMILFFYLSYIEKFGKFVHVIYLVTKKLAPYLLIIGFNIIYVSLGFYVIFSVYFDEFSTFFSCIKIIMEGFLGSFIYIETEEGSAMIWYFIIFSIYLLLCNAVFLNLIIAVLNNTYLKFHDLGKLFVSLQLYEVSKTHGYHKLYSSLISTPPPFNFFSMIFGFFLIKLKSQKFNEYLLKLAYFCFGFSPSFIIFFISHIIIIPFGWLTIIGLIIKNKYQTYDGFRYPVSRKITLFHMGMWIFGGIFYLFWNFLYNDCRVFFNSCFITIDNRITMKPVLKTDWMILKKIVREYLQSGVKMVKSNDFSEKLIEKYIDSKLETMRETVQGLRRVTKSEMIATDDLNTSNNINDSRNKKEDYDNSFESFKKKYKAEKLFQRFVVNGDLDIEKINILIHRLKKRNKRIRKIKGKIKKAYYLINLVNLKEFEEALRKWRAPELEEKRILDSLDYE